MADDEHTIGYWIDGSFYIYSQYSSLYVRREIKDVVKWRRLTAEERKTWDLPQSAVDGFKR